MKGHIDMSDSPGQSAIITGGGRGIGLAIARAFVKEGIAVTITDIDQGALDTARKELESTVTGARVMPILSDAKDPAGATEVVRLTVDEFGRLDILVNNAQQFNASKPLIELTAEDFATAYESGVFATWRYMVAAYPHLKATKGTVINMGSGAGVMAQPQQGAYGSNKEAIRGLTRIAAREWGCDDITVNAISPRVHSIESERFLREYPDQVAEVLKSSALGRFGDPEVNVGGTCVFLASPAGKFMTGATLEVNGGGAIRP
ncbi:SDR family NAD(P)-dependent oxidoreductase [Rhodococcus sp. T2V]|uniref:SDR family NAD(P)-dependent oxidoreductase n=1 Tax=Rhodococcus sp. T2V TaxID=3034164 RepID=UPI0023E0E228|nr:SDR family oxidoreductase [Rhodococcus sp. T2V]MDF3312125.1 SDR family NAD(P)-dependent oxidoreductase [Rhodococcus sp. T2V]